MYKNGTARLRQKVFAYFYQLRHITHSCTQKGIKLRGLRCWYSNQGSLAKAARKLCSLLPGVFIAHRVSKTGHLNRDVNQKLGKEQTAIRFY